MFLFVVFKLQRGGDLSVDTHRSGSHLVVLFSMLKVKERAQRAQHQKAGLNGYQARESMFVVRSGEWKGEGSSLCLPSVLPLALFLYMRIFCNRGFSSGGRFLGERGK